MPAQLGIALAWVLPPLLGAVIGYVTNALAIRMLFRPHTRWRFLGIPVPFTPGVIPRQRDRLAESIATMVSEKLLTPEILLGHLRESRFRDTVATGVQGITSEWLSRPLSEPVRTRIHAVVDSGAEWLHGAVIRFAASPAAESLATVIAAEITQWMRDQRASDLVGSNAGPRIAALVLDRGGPLLRETVRGMLDRGFASEQSLAELLPDSVQGRIRPLAARLYPRISEALVTWLESPDTRAELNTRGRELIKRVLGRLNLLQRFLVSATQYDRTLDQQMPEIVDDLLGSVRESAENPENRHRILDRIEHLVRGLLARPIPVLLSELELDPDELSDRVDASLVQLLNRDDVRQSVERIADSLIGGEASIADLAAKITGAETGALEDRIAGLLQSAISDSERVAALVGRLRSMVYGMIDRSGSSSVMEVAGITSEQKRRLDGAVTERALELVETRVPGVLQAVNIHGLVVNRINSLDMENVERLLLMVIQRHLKWINVFGALLGALIGGLQVLLSVLGLV